MSLTLPNNLLAVSLTPVNIFSAVSLTPAKFFWLFGYFDKFFAGVIDTAEQLIAGVNAFANISANFRKNSKRP